MAGIIITVMMSWGGFFAGFNGWLLKHLPMYNKFRAPSMIITVPTFLLCMLAVLSLDKILFGGLEKAVLQKQLKNGFIITGAVLAVLLVIYFNLDYQSEADKNILKQVAQLDEQVKQPVKSFINGLKEDRQGLFFGDWLRTLFFIAIAGASVWLYNRRVLKPLVALAIIGVFAFVDVMAVDVKYLSSDNYQEKEENEASFTPSAADNAILRDKGWYRVLDLSHGGIGGAFNQGALTAYHHNAVGGYHPAKLSLYQDLIEKQLYKYPACQNVLDMLNTKYIIENSGQAQVPARPTALGAAWFVKGVRFTNSAKEEMAALDNLPTKDSAVADKSFSNVLKSNFTFDSAATIQLVKNENDSARYNSKAASEQLAVFSEAYYNKGWNAFIDGKQVPYAKVNYVLRGLVIPAGEHVIEFKFEPKSHALGWTITNICSLLMLVMLGGAIGAELKRKKPYKVKS